MGRVSLIQIFAGWPEGVEEALTLEQSCCGIAIVCESAVDPIRYPSRYGEFGMLVELV